MTQTGFCKTDELEKRCVQLFAHSGKVAKNLYENLKNHL